MKILVCVLFAGPGVREAERSAKERGVGEAERRAGENRPEHRKTAAERAFAG